MKKFLLFVMTCVCVSIGAWATDGNGTFYGSSTWVISGSTLTVNVANRNDLSHWSDWDSGKPSDLTGVTKVVITGTIYSKTAEDAENGGGSDGANLGSLFKDYVLDLSGATMPTTTFWSVTGIVVGDNNNYSKNIIVPSVYASDPSSFPALQAYGAINGGINLYSINGTTLNASLGDLNNANISSVKGDCTTLKAFGFSSGSLSGIGFTYYDFTNTTLTGETTVPSGATVYVNSIEEKEYVKGAAEGNVIVRFNGNMTAAAGGSLGTNISTELGKYGQNNSPSNIETLNITGELTSTDVEWLNTNKSNLTGLKTVDLSGVTFGSGVSKSTIQAALPSNVFVTYPSFCDFDGSASVTTTSSNNLQTQLEAYLIGKGELSSSSTTEEKNAVLATVTSLTISGPLTSEDVTYLSKLTGLETLDLTGATVGAGVTKSSISSAVPTGATVLYPSASTVSGCNVTINMSNALGSDLTTLLTEAKAAVVAGGQSHICTLTVIGELKNADLAVLGDAAMTGATRIDLSGGTLATGASIDNLQLPSSLTSLVLPKDQTVSSVLAGKLEAAGNVNYAYSPSSDCTATGPNQADESKPATYKYDDTKNTIADYVWVVKAGGLAEALENEEQLRNSFYIKVASGVALTATDINFCALTNKPTNYLFLDLSESIMTPTVADSYTVEDNIPYRIILPNNWSNADLAHFQNNDKKGNLAAVYSYEDTKLNILVIKDNSYLGTALQNPRIVRAGTNAIDILPGEYVYDHQFGTANTNGKGIITAINNANPSIKSVYISIANTGNNYNSTYSFSNPNITYLNFDGLKSAYGTGPNVNVSGCTSLQTLDVKNADIVSLDAHNISSLTSVNLTGTKITGATNLSGTGLRTFTTNSSTNFGGALNLASTAITSFATPAKVTGDIYLNATPLTSLDLTTTQFQNTSSLIHIHATNDENDNNPIETLNSDGNKTISVTNNFNGVNNASPRIHPFTDIADNITEAAASGDATVSGCNDCKITYDATKGVATVHAVHAGHFAELMKTLYAGYPQGTTFKFDAACASLNELHLNLDDLKALCGKNPDNDMNWRSNYYYVDLYDVPATSDLCATPTTGNGLIYQWITWMRENDRQVKGLILPKDHTQFGSGTTLIQDGAGTNTQLATCSEFIAYYKTKDDQGDNLTQQTFVGHVYNQAPSAANAYQASYEKMLSLVDAHTYVNTNNETVPEVKTDADIVLITSNSATKVNSSSTSISGSTRIETINNEMVGTQTGKGSVYAYPNAPGNFAVACTSTGLPSTPTEMLQINGAISANDIAAINSFTNGPRVLDLRYANTSGTTGITNEMLEALTNTHIEYILLPEGQTKAVVCGSNYSDLTSLKAVISSTSTNCVAYVKTAGSLAEARYLATGGSVTPGNPNIYSPAKVGLTSVTLAGNLNAADIGCNLTTYHTDANGHWKNTSGDEASVGLSTEYGITSIDLADAVFVNKATTTSGGTTSYADMNLSWAGLANLSDIKLPTSTLMKDIPESCCEGMASLREICIPHNYEKIHNAAFLNSIVEHITTTDARGTLVDNGPNTYTLSANLKQVGDAPADNTVGLTATQTVFPQNRPVFDCYVLATKTPICYKNAFPANMLYGWGGFDGTLPYCRDKYVNGTNYYCVLRFPSQESYDATVADKRDTSYDLMKKQYTDVTKVYSKKEQTGAVDANGDEITWPTFSELRRAYNQATAGITWNRWVANYDSQQEVNGGENIPTSATGLTLGNYNSSNGGTANNDLGVYTFENYEGWHQFTLSQATYVEPDEVNPETREYVDAGWFTFCIPYDMTKKQVREWLGVPKSTDKITCKYGEEVVNEAKMPDIRQLQSVTRHTSTRSGDKNVVTFRLTTNLYNGEAGHYLEFDRTQGGAGRIKETVAFGTGDSDPVLRGGIPYIIKAYKRKGEKIKSYNLGEYIMTRYGDQFKLTQACLNHGAKYYEYLGSTSGSELSTLKFSKPYEEAVVVAANDTPSGSYCTYMDGDNTRDYEYALVGTFWDQKLPRYCFYQSKGKWYRNTNDNDYKWSAYKCVIMAVPYKAATSYSGYDGHNGQYYRENPSDLGIVEDNKSFYPSIEANTTDKLNGTLKIVFADGRDDDDFPTSGSNARYAFAFDDGIMEYDENGDEVTAIDRLDGGDIVPTDGKVYNMAGQYVGNNLNALGSGLYIVNGKKIVVK